MQEPKKKKKTTSKKPKPKTPHKTPHNLTAKEMNFLRYRVKEGNTLEVAYGKAYNNKTSPNNRRFEGYKILQRIITKVGSWHEVFTLCDIGPERLIQTFAEALEANSITIRGEKEVEYPDHRARVAAAKELMKIHGIGEENVNVKMDVTAKDITDNVPFVEAIADKMAKYDKEHNKD